MDLSLPFAMRLMDGFCSFGGRILRFGFGLRWARRFGLSLRFIGCRLSANALRRRAVGARGGVAPRGSADASGGINS